MTAFPWSFWLLLCLLLPVIIWWYVVQARRLSRSLRTWISRSKLRCLAAVQRRLRRLLADEIFTDSEEQAPRPAELHPRP
ncbi:hypothetical protein ACH4LT_07405 [Streptomyces clavifer]|uniref:hypothetical protein n=1 Tax=Streptomyces clavifer TaxID=68188 RepID=UPI00379CA3BC